MINSLISLVFLKHNYFIKRGQLYCYAMKTNIFQIVCFYDKIDDLVNPIFSLLFYRNNYSLNI